MYASAYLVVFAWSGHLLFLDLLLHVLFLHLHGMHESDCMKWMNKWTNKDIHAEILYFTYRISTCLGALRFFSAGSVGALSIVILTCMAVHMRKSESEEWWGGRNHIWPPASNWRTAASHWGTPSLVAQTLHYCSLMSVHVSAIMLRFPPRSGGSSLFSLFFHHVSSPSPGNNRQYKLVPTHSHEQKMTEHLY